MRRDDPQIETERLILRLPRREDFDDYCDLMCDPEASRYIGGPQTRAAAWRKFLQMPGAWMLQGYAMFSAIEKASGRWIGQVGPWQPEGWPGTEVGWSFRRVAWGRGFALEGAIATIDWAFANLGWTRVIHSIQPENASSQKLAQRLGSRVLDAGIRLPAPFEDVLIDVWGQTREEWQAHRDALRGATA